MLRFPCGETWVKHSALARTGGGRIARSFALCFRERGRGEVSDVAAQDGDHFGDAHDAE